MSPQNYDKLNQNDDECFEQELRKQEESYSARLRSPRLPNLNFLLALAAAFVLGGFTAFESLTNLGWAERIKSDLLPQVAFFPSFPSVLVNFTNGGEFASYDNSSDEAWQGLVPLGAGYLRVPNPQQYDLPPTFILNNTDQTNVYQASVIHQLHCLAFIRSHSRALENGEILEDVEGNRSHMLHFRQAIVCHADTTLEKGLPTGKFVGDGVLHQCRDWDAVMEFLVKKRAYNDVGSILHT
ncbi:hypothetical protein GLAREA_12532 [Glarea lozoyensis ATCC 20868]|uniref:Uncharacterized protein n=1 Tax=Glarea lozoyensis (strain ATCC 20868 / MF5171) TaxID=1116229 RepID=S3D254_GLAL2|nr:uncharacterized protein GLAREA_12532 [Glarea lozoyensis ATCC 20868]EPE31229.1 hypothetical protein GLAREA_12532 [Glarea lozoyensis ATCC 20868]